jgi:hypothetical protein
MTFQCKGFSEDIKTVKEATKALLMTVVPAFAEYLNNRFVTFFHALD